MSQAVKCDRCGKMFAKEDTAESWATIEHVVYKDRESYKRRAFIKHMEYLDLCPMCAIDFELFMDDCPLVIRTDICEENPCNHAE